MKKTLSLIIITFFIYSCNTDKMEKNRGPIANKTQEKITIHGDTRIDNYFWMRLSDEQKKSKTPDTQTQNVLDYLNAENDHLKTSMKHTEPMQKKLYDEITSRIKQDDASVPYKKNGYTYYSRYEKGQDYAYNCRKKDAENAIEEIMLNGPEMGKDKSYFALGGMKVSTNNNLIVYGVDLVSRREYTLYFKDLSTGENLDDKIEATTGGAVWANDNQTIFYTKKDPQTLRAYQIYKHTLGTDQNTDELVFEEKDETFSCYIQKSKSDKYLIISSSQTLSSEHRFLDAETPNGEWTIIQPREKNHKYSINHFDDHFYIKTNLDAKNFKIVKTPVSSSSKENWTEVIAHRKDVFIEGIELFKNYLVVEERENGLPQLRVIKWEDNTEHFIEFNDPTYTSYISYNPQFNTEILRYGYTSLTTPYSVYDYDMNSKKQELLKQTEVVDPNFSPENYTSERMFATVRDGIKVPISLVYKKGTKRDAKTPLLLYSYGSYGSSTDPGFSSQRLSLLDRGFVFAIAHIRGGQEMGKHWYEDGKLLKKKNTFYDFIDCGKYLVDNNYTSPEHLYAMGGSAGGLLMGAIINMEPKLWNGVIAAVPFVDVVSTMLDETIPLTTFEFDEWGNPKEKESYDYMKSYSPYDNVEKKEYPNLLITTGYWDSQVQYWEPAKWIAKLRENKTDTNQLMMHCNMEVGHGGASGRFERYKEVALEYSFFLNLEGINL
jgi:oligopeptidase B